MHSLNSNLEELSEKLLIRSQEAILQLDLWILRQQQQHNDHRFGTATDTGNKTKDSNEALNALRSTYDLYMSQLNSLYVRSEFIRDKLNSEKNNVNKFNLDHRNIEELVFEFQNIREKLNQLAASSKLDKHSPPKTSTRSSSMESMNLKPLKVVAKHEKRMSKELELKNKEKSVTFGKETRISLTTNGIGGKLMIKDDSDASPQLIDKKYKVLRNAISYDTGLNSKSKSNKRSNREYRKKNDAAYDSLFKNKQRFSISLFEDYVDTTTNTNYNEFNPTVDASINTELIENNSDQETVISSSHLPCITNEPLDDYILSNSIQLDKNNNSGNNEGKKSHLRRCNSHESILSTKLENTFYKNVGSNFYDRFIFSSFYRPTVASVSTTSTNIEPFLSDGKNESPNKNLQLPLTSSTRGVTSRELLSKFADKPEQLKAPTTSNSNSSKYFFENWGLFSSMSSSSTFHRKNTSGSNIISSEVGKKLCDRSTGIKVTSINTQNAYTFPFIRSNSHDITKQNITNPIIKERVSYNELHDALNTEIKLLF
ncbi:hypothetical protein TPHA_0E04020 [Tetrapisispora phaffii CBS 4417]|uniref:Uncharacterized protein n=1 Tax=Tetrapisispora phaffii (strain ATCC 24235 / CBS 4417 / NBRC 1672 / NRRL Y-8282 / UCD 70-5) TaxID=1071381 RepID=G8BUB3_TETPH|nr:hypothetical protein TPHA_0E04020 [Tetrapisispora phaffii CBS 4417]CCE63491.1 hypothetical protein TPHA_0E04020 [Tetrapisispora phaffii CBS 4417]